MQLVFLCLFKVVFLF